MPHERKLLRDAVAAQLVAAATSAGSRVELSRMGPLKASELPAICVYTNSETVEEVSRAPRVLTRAVELEVEGWVEVDAGENVDDALDALALEIEEAMDTDPEHDSCALSSILTATEYGVSPKGAKPMGCVRLTYAVEYESPLRVEAAGENFDTANVKIEDVGAPEGDLHATNQPEDNVTDIYQGP